MFFDNILQYSLIFLTEIINLLPTANTETINTISSSSTAFRGFVEDASWLIPANTLLTLLSAVVIIEFSLLVFKIIRWLLSMLSFGIVK